ncbi:hypothetical protein BTI_1900 [Burkholderia thailandensis MSMB121]|uniref:hypothetical protein n=1 Tax=Burkholderia humptydooensis TaxID=430531 RepID=UPI000328057B|nr:hypothetical protein [Burkholderia humptydooensis]AGK47715.1 hypothetical protein BTI_1900 [Burkholderia thailandensis MSMB121]
MNPLIHGHSILVTGACGAVGSELIGSCFPNSSDGIREPRPRALRDRNRHRAAAAIAELSGPKTPMCFHT